MLQRPGFPRRYSLLIEESWLAQRKARSRPKADRRPTPQACTNPRGPAPPPVPSTEYSVLSTQYSSRYGRTTRSDEPALRLPPRRASLRSVRSTRSRLRWQSRTAPLTPCPPPLDPREASSSCGA
jgi:hypothetical protein